MRPITDVLRELNEGQFVTEVSEAFQQLVKSATTTGKAGVLKIKLKLKPGKNHQAVMSIEADFDATMPEFDRPADFMYVTKDHTLVRDNPNQRKLDLREVSIGTGEKLDTETGEIKVSV